MPRLTPKKSHVCRSGWHSFCSGRMWTQVDRSQNNVYSPCQCACHKQVDAEARITEAEAHRIAAEQELDDAEARITEVEAERDEALSAFRAEQRMGVRLHQERRAAEAEVRRLREALERISAGGSPNTPGDIARSALAAGSVPAADTGKDTPTTSEGDLLRTALTQILDTLGSYSLGGSSGSGKIAVASRIARSALAGEEG